MLICCDFAIFHDIRSCKIFLWDDQLGNTIVFGNEENKREQSIMFMGGRCGCLALMMDMYLKKIEKRKLKIEKERRNHNLLLLMLFILWFCLECM